jgi:O-antigen/teichoic acid export membrane protein
MAISIGFLLKGTVWTAGAYGLTQAMRFLTNVILARLLSPDLFGIMLIFYTLRTGLELMSDVGIGQNIIYHENANEPEFYNTAWSLQVLKGIVLWLICLAAAAPAANFYHSPIIASIVPVASLGLVFTGLTSISIHLLQKRMRFARLNVFETSVAIFGMMAHIVLAYLSPTVWALVFGGLSTSVAMMIGSQFVLPDVKVRFRIAKRFAFQILGFGKWIFASSIVYFLSMNFDRLYLAKIIPLEVLGIYGIARTISELLSTLVQRFGNVLVFPVIASHSQTDRDELRGQLVSIRGKFFLPIIFGLPFFVVTADLAIRILYDQRYQAASWMLSVLVIGSWFSALANINESTLLGLGRPSYGAASNFAKFVFLLVGVPLAYGEFGLIGAVTVVSLADLCRYVPILIGQMRERLSFGIQDLVMTLAVFGLIGVFEFFRWASGFGTSIGIVELRNLLRAAW